ncbi:MAG: hypothetical protein P8016_07560 [Sedimentisphaerales bacterium]
MIRVIFKSISAIMTTDLSVVGNESARPYVFLFSRVLSGMAGWFGTCVHVRKTVECLNPPEKARAICYYRDAEFYLIEPDTKL